MSSLETACVVLESRQGSSGHSANRQQSRSWELGPGHTVATGEHEAFWKSQQSRGEVKEDNRNTAQR